MNDIFTLFIKKLPESMETLMPDRKKMVTYLNPYSMYVSKSNIECLKQFDYISSDGILPLILNRIFGINKSMRLSFDMSSIGKAVFEYCSQHNKSIYFIGSNQDKLDKFISSFKEMYPNILLKGWRDGFFQSIEEENIVTQIINTKPDVVIVGLGTPKQDLFALELKNSGYCGTVYTCGGFIHQAAEKFEYFNGFVDKFHIRWLYRIFKEKYVLKRVVLYYPKFIISYFWFLFFNSKKFK
jgi:N-acetylglucosaminyldiphosphoundecaprenol N-acetyl-beta-D-mannosaminyltransferase